MADLINIQCPQCQAIHSVAAEYLYKKVRCPKCTVDFAAYEIKPQAPVMPPPNDGPDIFSMFITILCVIFLVIELFAMLIFLVRVIDPTLPEGPISLALSQQAQTVRVAKIYMLVDTGLMVVTVVILMMARICSRLSAVVTR